MSFHHTCKYRRRTLITQLVLISGARPEVTQCIWSSRENDLSVLLRHQRDVLWPVLLQTSTRKL